MSSAILYAIRESFGRVVFSHKTHEKEADIRHNQACWLKRFNLILIVLTFSGLMGLIFTTEEFLLQAATILAATSLALTVYWLSFNPEEKAQAHKHIATLLWHVREEYINLMADVEDSIVAAGAAAARRDELTQRLGTIYSAAPTTSRRAYRHAKKALKIDEEFSFSEEEINSFLPESLRKD